MYQNYIAVIIYLFRITKDSSQKLLNFTESTFRKRAKSKWKALINKDSSSNKEPIFNQQSKVSNKNSKRTLNSMKLTISES